MSMIKLGLAPIALACVLAAPAMAQTAAPAAPAMPAKPEPKPVYFNPDAFPPALTVPAPVTPDSAEGKAELEVVRQTIAAATPERIAQAARDDGNESVMAFADVLPGFDVARLPATKKLFDGLRNDENMEARVYKMHFARLRPYEIDPSIKTCVPSKPTAPGKTPSSYPSGHATMGYSMAVVLAHLVPEKAGTIFARARAYGENRVVCGVHFPSDTVASEVIGTLVAYDLLRNPAFMKDYAAARAELVAAGLTR